MQKGDVVGGIGAIGSTVFAVLGYLWNIDIIQMMFTFLAGAFSTYVVQHRLQVESEKRRISREHGILMRDKIYGPLFTALNQIYTEVIDVKDPHAGSLTDNPMNNMKRVLDDHLYLLIKEELKGKVFDIYFGLLEYRQILFRAQRAVFDVAQRKLSKIYPNVMNLDSRQIYFYLYEYEMPVQSISFEDAIMRRINPYELFEGTMTNLESPEIRIVMGSHRFEDLEKMKKSFIEIEQLAWKEKRLLEHEAEHKTLVDAVGSIIPELRKMIISEK